MSEEPEVLMRRIAELEEALTGAEGKNALIQEYLSGLSHDIRTPMNAVMGFSSLLGELEDETGELGYYARMITRSSKKLLETISNLIDFARLETGNLHIMNDDVNIAELFEELQEEMEEELALYEKSAIRLEFRPLYNGSGIIHTDRLRLQQILRTFLENSLKFTKQGRISLISSLDQEGWITFEVADTGVGIDEDTLRNLFNLFSDQQTGSGSKIKTRGLGMLVAKRLTHLLHGDLKVNSTLEKGTRVYLKIQA